ncbi:MAG: hypothetical protein PHT07_11205 [Paludibacter sp.]|nr:hypothetical protein [Paludibacter sp.]
MRTMIKAFAIQGFLSLIIATIVFLISGSFLYAAIFFTIILSIRMVKPTLTILNILIKCTKWYEMQAGDGVKFRKQIDTDLDICNLGSNSGKFAFSYAGTGLKGENWALGPQTLSYDYRVLKNYSGYLKEGATVLIPLCPFSGCIKDFKEDMYNYKYYSFLHPIFILNYSEDTKKKALRFVDTPFQAKPIKSIIRILKDVSIVPEIKMNEESLENNANTFINSWKEQFSITDLDEPVSEQNKESLFYNTNLLSDMISFCLERNLKPVIVIPPITKHLNSEITTIFRENYIYSFINAANNNKVPFLNYLDDTSFLDDDLYINSYFLNKKGQKLFTLKVLADLKLIEK